MTPRPSGPTFSCWVQWMFFRVPHSKIFIFHWYDSQQWQTYPELGMRWSKLLESSVSRANLESSTRYCGSLLYFPSSYFVSKAGYWYWPPLRRLIESLWKILVNDVRILVFSEHCSYFTMHLFHRFKLSITANTNERNIPRYRLLLSIWDQHD